MSENKIRKNIFHVRGMHCPSCEILIEKKISELPGVKSVDVSLSRGEVLLICEKDPITKEELNRLFEKDKYLFFEKPVKKNNTLNLRSSLLSFGLAILIILGFLGLNRLGIAELVNVSSKSSLPAFFIFGLIAGISSCAALVGGLVLSLSKQWMEMYSDKDSLVIKLQPHFMFNLGRLLSYAFLGAVLGAIGSKLQISLTVASAFVFLVSALMILFALSMLGVKGFERFQFSTPKFITRYISDETKFKGRFMPALMGALTFFLPCGFTITAQGMALLSANFIQGGLIMLFFALGTLPTLMVIGFSTVKFLQKPDLAAKFLKVAGVLVIFFALFNINSQMNVLGITSLNDFGKKNNSTTFNDKDLPSLVNGKQLISMEASSSGYKPNYFKVRVGVPVRWEIKDIGTSGCTNAVISKGLFTGSIPLSPGKISVKEFTPQKVGRYKFSCWMGMVTGTIEVVGPNQTNSVQNNFSTINESSNSPAQQEASKVCGCGANK